MPSEIVHRKPATKARFGNPPESSWYDGIQKGYYPAPDVELSPGVPGWTDSHIARHQEAMRLAAAKGRRRRKTTAQLLRRLPRKVKETPTSTQE